MDEHDPLGTIEVKALRSEVATLLKAVYVRIDAIDKATALLHEDTVRVPTQIDRAIANITELLRAEINGDIARVETWTKEKFNGVDAQFSERDTRTDQRAGDTKLAVDAAFAAAKEATAKIEAGFTKQLDAIGSIIDTKTVNLEGNISDLKDRMTAMESIARSAAFNRTDARASSGQLMTAVALGFLGLSVLIAATALFVGHMH
jgi:ribosome-associated translation inhibitor RaiA